MDNFSNSENVKQLKHENRAELNSAAFNSALHCIVTVNTYYRPSLARNFHIYNT